MPLYYLYPDNGMQDMETLAEIHAQLDRWEPKAKNLEPSAAQRKRWLQAATGYAEQFVDDIDNKPAYVAGQYDKATWDDIPIPAEGQPIENVIALLQERLDTPGLNPASGGHLGYIPGGGLYPAALGDYLADIFNRYAGVYFAGPGAVNMENHLIDWMKTRFHFPETAVGNLTSGGSIANLIALVTAREHHQVQPENIRQQVIYLTQQVHHCIQKAIRIGGLEYATIRQIPMDASFAMDISLLQQQIAEDKAAGLHPMMLIGTAGTTDTGAIDPLEDMAQIARKHNMWFHVDGAYGGFFQLTAWGSEKLKGIEKADSLVVDPHKGLFLPYGIGAVLIRHPESLYRSHHYRASYLLDTEMEEAPLSPADGSPELTKHFRGLRMWLSLQLLGTDAIVAALHEKRWLALYCYRWLEAIPRIRMGRTPELTVVLFRVDKPGEEGNRASQQLMRLLQAEGRVFVSSTIIDGLFWLHVAILSFRTHRHTIDILIENVKKLLPQTLNTEH